MSIDLELAHNGRIAILHFGETFTIDELSQMAARLKREVYDNAPKRVYPIIDLLGVVKMPANIVGQTITQFRVSHPNEGPVTIVLHNRFFVSLTDVYNRVARRKARVFTALDEAIESLDRLIALEP